MEKAALLASPTFAERGALGLHLLPKNDPHEPQQRMRAHVRGPLLLLSEGAVLLLRKRRILDGRVL